MRPAGFAIIPALVAALLLAGCQTTSGGGSSGSDSSSGSSGSTGSTGSSGSSGSSDSTGSTGSTGSSGSMGMPGSSGTAMPSGAGDSDTGAGAGADAGTSSSAGGDAGANAGSGPAGTPPAGGAPGEGASVPGGDGAQTPEERRAAVDRRLDDSLGQFDERIRKEQAGVARERDSRAGGGSGADTDSGDEVLTAQTGGRPGDLRSDRGGGTPQQGGEASGGDASGGDSGPARTSAGTGGTGKSVVERADGSDDDIVARRLRRAAEQETDPELKERLWKEYDDYKKSVRGG